MKKLVIGIATVALVAVGAYSLFAIDTNASNQSVDGNSATYTNEEFGFEFTYRPGLNGYVLEESEYGDHVAHLLRSIVLMTAEDAAKDVVIGGEGPATINVLVFENVDDLSPQVWAETYVQYSNLNLKMGDISEAVVDGEEGIRYLADGLYPSENVIVAHGDKMYVVSGMYLDEHSDLRQDFEPLVESIRFIP